MSPKWGRSIASISTEPNLLQNFIASVKTVSILLEALRSDLLVCFCRPYMTGCNASHGPNRNISFPGSYDECPGLYVHYFAANDGKLMGAIPILRGSY